MLIKCPECGKEFSDKADKCPNCGIYTKDALDLITKIKAEEKKKEEASKNNKTFDYYGTKYDFSEMYKKYISIYYHEDGSRKPLNGITEEPLLEAFYKDMMEYVPSLSREEAIKIKNYFLREKAIPFSMDEVNRISDEVDRNVKKLKAEIDQKLAAKNNARCPYCNSTNTKKISTLSRMGSFATFGFAGKKVGKQWHCNNCKSDF